MAEHVEGKVPVYNKNTGEMVEYWPRDAQEAIGRPDSEWTLTPVPVPFKRVPPVAHEVPPEERKAAEAGKVVDEPVKKPAALKPVRQAAAKKVPKKPRR